MTVIGGIGQAVHASDQPFLVCRGHRDLDTKLITLAGFPRGDAFNFWRMQAVELVLVFGFLFEQPFDTGQNGSRFGLLFCVVAIELTVDVAPNSPDECAEFPQGGVHTPVLSGVGVSSHLGGEPRCFPVVVLAQGKLHGVGEFDQMLAGSFEQAAISRVGHRFFHDGGVDNDLVEALFLDDFTSTGSFNRDFPLAAFSNGSH